MGVVSPHPLVALAAGILYSDSALCETACKALEEKFGKISARSGEALFDKTNYYCGEMGPVIKRFFVLFETTIGPEDIAGIKNTTNSIEASIAVDGMRKVNIDPAYVDLSKAVIVSTKNASYRIYLRDGIYAQPLYYFKDGSFHPYEWTYPDYKDKETILFFNEARSRYKELRKK